MKKGDATMVATVLLIVMAIVTGVLVVSFSRESEKKVEKKIINLGSAVECQDVGVGLEIEDTGIKIKNKGTLGINKIILRMYAETPTTKTIGEGSEPWSKYIVAPYNSDKIYPNEVTDKMNVYDLPNENFNKIEFIPIIIVNNDEIGCEGKIVTWENKK